LISALLAISTHGEQYPKKRKEKYYYRRVASDASDTTCYKRKQVCNRSAEIIIPWTLPFFLIKIMKHCPLCRTSIPICLGAFDPE